MVDWVTFGFTSPGVRVTFGKITPDAESVTSAPIPPSLGTGLGIAIALGTEAGSELFDDVEPVPVRPASSVVHPVKATATMAAAAMSNHPVSRGTSI